MYCLFRLPKIRTLDFRKTECNKTEYSKTERIYLFTSRRRNSIDNRKMKMNRRLPMGGFFFLRLVIIILLVIRQFDGLA